MIEEEQTLAQIRAAEYKNKLARFHSRRVRQRDLQTSDLVLRKTEGARQQVQDGKLAASWEGPFRVRIALQNGAYKLETIEGKEIPRSWNISHLKLYFPQI